MLYDKFLIFMTLYDKWYIWLIFMLLKQKSLFKTLSEYNEFNLKKWLMGKFYLDQVYFQCKYHFGIWGWEYNAGFFTIAFFIYNSYNCLRNYMWHFIIHQRTLFLKSILQLNTFHDTNNHLLSPHTHRRTHTPSSLVVVFRFLYVSYL